MKKLAIIIGVVVFSGLIAGGTYFLKKLSSEQTLLRTQANHPPCLSDNEVATFQFYGNQTTATSADIIINDKVNNDEVYRFTINNLVPNHYYPYEIYKCGIYVVREFNFDYTKGKPLPGFKMEVWRYSYDGNGEKLVEANDFRISPDEIHLAFVRGGYLEHPDYALVIRNIKANTDDFTLLRKDLTEEYPKLPGLFSLRTWTRNGNYFWADLFVAAKVEAFLRVMRSDWKVDVLSVPRETEGGTALNPEFGYITYDTGPSWVGIDIVQEEIKKDWQKEGKAASFYLYNLFSKERVLLATTTDPFWPFKPRWLSDTELEYHLPSGERKTYNLENK